LNLTLAETLVDAETGEIIVEKGTVLTHQVMEELGIRITNHCYFTFWIFW
jgi:DNA-directed RNA polymerase subunit beta